MNAVKANSLLFSKLTGMRHLGMESALDYWNLGSVIAYKPIFIDSINVSTSNYDIVKGDKESGFYQDTETELFYTDIERTLCDMILNKRCEEHLVSALADYICMKDDITKLTNYAKELGIENELNELIKEADDCFDYYYESDDDDNYC